MEKTNVGKRKISSTRYRKSRGIHLDESVILFVIEMDRNYRLVALEAQPLQILAQAFVAEQVHFGHLRIEEVSDRLFGGIHRDVANV